MIRIIIAMKTGTKEEKELGSLDSTVLSLIRTKGFGRLRNLFV